MRHTGFATTVLVGIALLLSPSTPAQAEPMPSNDTGFVQVGSIGANAVYRIVNRHSGKCLEILGWSTAPSAHAGQWDCHDGNNQKWEFVRVSGSVYQLRNVHSRLCLYAWSNNNGTTAQQLNCNHPEYKYTTHWTSSGTSSNKTWRLKSVYGLCLEMLGWSTRNGDKAGTWSCTGGYNQYWY